MKILNVCTETSAFILFHFVCEVTWGIQSVQPLGYVTNYLGCGVPIPVQTAGFFFSITPKPALGSTQFPIEWVPGAVP
jgi:hypothetical protein